MRGINGRSNPCCQQHASFFSSGKHHSRLCGEEIDGTRAVAVFLNETAVVLCTGCRVDGRPAMFAVVAKAVDVATEVGGVTTSAMQTLAFITDLVIQNIRLDFNLGREISFQSLQSHKWSLVRLVYSLVYNGQPQPYPPSCQCPHRSLARTCTTQHS